MLWPKIGFRGKDRPGGASGIIPDSDYAIRAAAGDQLCIQVHRDAIVPVRRIHVGSYIGSIAPVPGSNGMIRAGGRKDFAFWREYNIIHLCSAFKGVTNRV